MLKVKRKTAIIVIYFELYCLLKIGIELVIKKCTNCKIAI